MEFTFELLHPIYDSINDEVDVIVNFLDDKSQYHVTLITYQRAKEIFTEHAFSLFSNTIFVEKLTKEEIRKALQYTINQFAYLLIFYPINKKAVQKLNQKIEVEQKAKKAAE